MKNRSCPNKVMCFDYDASNCEDCAVGTLINKQKAKIRRLKAENGALREQLNEAVKYVAEHIKMAFYYEFDELIPSIMADKIDEIVKEALHD